MAVPALLRACHPLPAAAVTAFGTALGVAAGADLLTAAVLAAALATGQVSIGWLNDLVDAGLDARAGRVTKPLATGELSPASVRAALLVAALLCVPLSLALGLLPGLLHLLFVAAGWSYNLGLKLTALSPLPYLVGFALVPVVARAAAGAPVGVPLALASGLLGVAAHFANTVPDAEADAATGVRGLPQRLGPRLSQRTAAGGVVLACLVLLVAARPPLPATALLTAAAAVGVGSAVAVARLSFRLTLVAAALAVAGVVVAG